jgi:hypothetical protein
MTENFTETASLPAMPAFIMAAVDGGAPRFNFWMPQYSGDEQQDFVIGQAHFTTAIEFAQASRFQDLLGMIVGGMIDSGAGPMERGFVRCLAEKATYGRVPAPEDNSSAQAALVATDRTMEELRHGEREAREYLDLARELRSPGIIEWIMVDIVNGDMKYGALTFLWTVCRAAYAGCEN